MCGVGAVVGTDPDGAVTNARVALISVGDGPVLVDVTPAVTGGGFDRAALNDLIDHDIDPEDDIHATAEYRRHLAHVLTARTLEQARERTVTARRAGRAA
jgi:carbon-monoxide dehydrogenase medium subunit